MANGYPNVKLPITSGNAVPPSVTPGNFNPLAASHNAIEINDQMLAGYIQQEIQQSQNWQGSEWRESIKQSLNYLLLRDKGDEVPGRSRIQSGDVADMLDHIHAEIQPLYGVDDIVEIGKEGPEDEQAAEETEFLNWYWKERIRGFEILDEAVQDACLSRNGYVKVYYEESYGLPYEETLEGLRIQIDADLVELEGENKVEILGVEITQESVVDVVPYNDPANPDGLIWAEIEVQPELQRVTVKLTPKLKEVKAVSVAPEDMFVSKDAASTSMQQPRFVAHRRRMARQSIAALGFDPVQVARMPSVSVYDQDVRTARKQDFNTYARYAAHKSGELADLFECYYLIDRDGDGLPELWKVFYSSNREVLNYVKENGELESSAEMVRVRPFACGTIMKVAHRHQGRSIYDKEKQVEDTKRALIRQMIDNMDIANDNTLVVSDMVSSEDVEETETGKVIRATNPATDVVALQWNDIAGHSLNALGYMDKVRRERGGAAIDMSSANMPINQAAHSTERIMSAMEKLLALYARTLANTLIRDVFVLLHQQLQLLPGTILLPRGDEWAEVEPRRWVQRNRISVTLGMSEGEKLKRRNALMNIIQVGDKDAETADGVLVDFDSRYQARLELARVDGLPRPEQYWVDPESPAIDPQEQQQQRIPTKAEAFRMRQQQMAEQQAQMQQQMVKLQQDTLMRITEMQEVTKRQANENDKLEAQRDRLFKRIESAEKRIAEFAKMALQAGIEIPGLTEAVEEGLEGELIAFPGQ